MLSHIFGLFINPRKEWQLIHDSACSVTKCYLSYVLILAAIPPISGYFGTTLFGWQFGARDPVKLTSESALTIAIAYYMVMLVGVFTIGAMIQWMGKTYGAEQPLSRT
ncbi:MAG: Yip1 family protein, partial [Gammaproteobacteria bacterium]